MEQLLERTAHADANELIDIVDELRVIEHELGLVSECDGTFEMEDEEIRIAHLSTIRPTTRLLGEEEPEVLGGPTGFTFPVNRIVDAVAMSQAALFTCLELMHDVLPTMRG